MTHRLCLVRAAPFDECRVDGCGDKRSQAGPLAFGVGRSRVGADEGADDLSEGVSPMGSLHLQARVVPYELKPCSENAQLALRKGQRCLNGCFEPCRDRTLLRGLFELRGEPGRKVVESLPDDLLFRGVEAGQAGPTDAYSGCNLRCTDLFEPAFLEKGQCSVSHMEAVDVSRPSPAGGLSQGSLQIIEQCLINSILPQRRHGGRRQRGTCHHPLHPGGPEALARGSSMPSRRLRRSSSSRGGQSRRAAAQATQDADRHPFLIIGQRAKNASAGPRRTPIRICGSRRQSCAERREAARGRSHQGQEASDGEVARPCGVGHGQAGRGSGQDCDVPDPGRKPA
ncbi:hypothetical protein KY5_7349c [Streptomyces formicae]|uniref:Uncharacterized protein n=1 Tax=Streptomyces formicae TaxID=1616117 RepID=A0A291QLF6_9ACTN|nr:hypothetical protein KY5_7349c [Streptomyces formicae]